MSGPAPQAEHSPDPLAHLAADGGGIWRRIREHKIIQWSLGYLAAALALTHAEELIANAFDWPEFVSRALIVVLALGLPLAITLAWYHGHRASRHVSGAEATIIAILLLMGAGLLWVFVRPRETPPLAEGRAATEPTQPSARALAASAKPRLAILPFENLSPDPANAFFTDGLHEEIISTLSSGAPDLEVISRTTMMTYRTPKPVEEIARELGATHVLEGSVQREGNAVRLTLQLIDARRDQHVWSHDYNRTLESALTLESDVASEVASQLSAQLAGHSTQRIPPTTDPQAYDLYLKTRLEREQSTFSNIWDVARVRGIGDQLEEAIRRDPKFALARLDLADHYIKTSTTPCCNDGDLRRAREQLDAAQTLIPGDPLLTVTRAVYNYWTDADAPLTPAVEAALTADVQDLVTFGDGTLLFVQAGRFGDALALVERLRRVDPANSGLLGQSAQALIALRRPQEALAAADAMRSRPGWEIMTERRAYTLYGFTGRSEALRTAHAAFDRYGAGLGPIRFLFQFQYLMFEHRYTDLRRLLEQAGQTEFPKGSSPGSVPSAEILGWTALVMGDTPTVRRQSDAIVAYLARVPKTYVQAWYGKALLAEARLFIGDNEGAIAAAHQSLATRPRERDAGTWPLVGGLNARILAWAGAQDEAVQLLENLSTVEGGLLPAEITRDPQYDVPLARNARYRALKAKLEAQMAATKLD